MRKIIASYRDRNVIVVGKNGRFLPNLGTIAKE
jgi:hypothetical protein